MKNKKVRILTAVMLIVAMFTLAACAQTPVTDEPAQETKQQTSEKPSEEPADKPAEEPKDEPTETALSGTIELIGSTSVQPLAETLAEEFMALNPDVTINVQGGGSSVGVQSALDKLCDIGDASRNLKDSEKGQGLIENVIALDGIAVVVHPNNPVSDLTVEQVRQIYMGEITNWKEVGGDDKEIIVFNREAASGTRGAFIELAELEEKQDDGSKKLLITEKALEANSNGALKTSVSTKEDAIGYVSLGSIDESIKAVSIDGVQATAQNVIDGAYTLYRPFLMLTNGEPSEVTQAFLDFIMSADGQAIVADKYISANS